MSDKKFVTYLEFGAKGDGKTNDFAAIKAAHDYANEHGIPVKIEGDNTYYIGDVEIDGKPEIAIIKTDVDWGNAKFIIDDNVFALDGINVHGKHYMHIFKVDSDYEMTVIEDRALLDKVVSEGFNKKTVKVNLNLGYPAMIIPHNSKEKVYKRKGYGGHLGYDMKEVVVLDKDGNFDAETPLMFDYNNLDSIDVFRLDIKPLTIQNGTFTTIANKENTVLRGEDGKVKGIRDLYFKRGINVNRSFTTVKNVKHYVVEGISPKLQVTGVLGVGYYGFFATTLATNVTYEDCVLTGRRCYSQVVAGVGKVGPQGTYDLHCDLSNKIVFKNCIQSNFWINDEAQAVEEGTRGAKCSMSSCSAFNEKGVPSRVHWGIGGSNDCKNMEYYGCTLSRFDAHRGLYNGKIIDSTICCASIVGGGDFIMENVRWFAEGPNDHGNALICTRSDYGSPWDGTVTIKNVKAYPQTESEYPTFLMYRAYDNWDFGYTCRFPSMNIENLKYYDRDTGKPMPEGFEVKLLQEKKSLSFEPALHLPETLNSHPFYTDFSGVKRGGIEDTESYKNLNPIVPPEYIKIIGNDGGYVFAVPNTYEYKGLGENGFFEKTKFYYSETEYYEGTNHTGEDTKTFKFVSLE